MNGAERYLVGGAVVEERSDSAKHDSMHSDQIRSSSARRNSAAVK